MIVGFPYIWSLFHIRPPVAQNRIFPSTDSIRKQALIHVGEDLKIGK